MSRFTFVVLLLATVSVGQSPSALQFTDVTAQCGIAWLQNDPGDMMGVGGAWLDFDDDGNVDLLLVGGVSAPTLYRNLGASFVDVTAGSGIVAPVGPNADMGAAVSDFDNDGDPDVYIYSRFANRLYRNDGGGVFSDVAASAGVGGAEWTASAAFADYDGDGFDDLYVGNYVAVSNFPYHTPFLNILYRNNGDGTFSDVTTATGTAGAGTTLAVSWSDFDDDGDPDLIVGNDFGAFIEPNLLYRNDGAVPGPPGSWSFTEVSQALGSDIGIYCMGITAADIDRDLDKDYYFSNLGRNVMLRNDGAAGFSDITTAAGVENTNDPTTTGPVLFATGWGVGFHDFDLDGWSDLYVSNGHIPAAPMIANGTMTPSALYHHDGAAITFSEMASAAGIADTGIGRAAFFADYDNDGDIDVLQPSIAGMAKLYRNDSPNQGNHLSVRTRGRVSARDGQGTRIQLDFDGYGLVREVNRNYSFESASQLDVNFGLGSETTVDRISARWRSGITHQVHDVNLANLAIDLVEPIATVGPSTNGPASLQEGQTGTWSLEIVNHTGNAQTIFHVRRVRALGTTLHSDPIETTVVPAHGSVVVPWTITLPLGATGGATFDAELHWRLFDVGGGIDGWKATATLMP